MKANHKLGLTLILAAALFGSSVFSVGFASWAFIATAKSDLYLGADSELTKISSGITIESTPLKMGKYFYENPNGSGGSETGYLTYTITITPAQLIDSMKNNYSSGYRFSLSGSLRLDNPEAASLFSSTYFEDTVSIAPVTEGLSISNATIDLTEVETTIDNHAFSTGAFPAFTITTAGRGLVEEKFTISFGLKRALLWANVDQTETSYRSLLLNSNFVLRLEQGD